MLRIEKRGGGVSQAELWSAAMSVREEPSVEEIKCYRITNSKGAELGCISLGATITELKLPDG